MRIVNVCVHLQLFCSMQKSNLQSYCNVVHIQSKYKKMYSNDVHGHKRTMTVPKTIDQPLKIYNQDKEA